MIAEQYQVELKNQLTRTQYLLLVLIVGVLQIIKKVKLQALAEALPLPILFGSRRKKVQRFLDLPDLSLETCWFPCFKKLLGEMLVFGTVAHIAIDRTCWGCINILMVSLIWENRAWPVYWTLLEKKGNSNLEEQKKVFNQIFPLFKNYKIVVLGDREFCSPKLGKYLGERDAYFCLRQKKDTNVRTDKELWIELRELGLNPGMSLFLNGVNVTKGKGFGGFNVACKWKRKYRGFAPDEPWYILTNLESLDQAIPAYQKRFDIEEMFRDFKKGGYNLEETKVEGERLITLVLLIAIAYTTASIQGKTIKRMGRQKYIGRVREAKRSSRRHSSFYIGLHAHNWVNLFQNQLKTVQELMQINRNKLPYYLKGMRAIELVQSAL